MPFGHGPYAFTKADIELAIESGSVYGLAKPSLANLKSYVILYVGKTVNLRKRLQEHFNNPPVSGITHFFADATTEAERTQREYALNPRVQARPQHAPQVTGRFHQICQSLGRRIV